MLNHKQAITSYTELSRRIREGAYDKLKPDDSYPVKDEDVLKDIHHLEWHAYREGLKFVGHDGGTFTLEPMTDEEKREYVEAVMQGEENSTSRHNVGSKRSPPRPRE